MSVTKKIIIQSPKIYKPVGPYSQAIIVDNTMYISGVLGLDINANLAQGAVTQTRQALENLKHVLASGGSSLEAVVKTTVLLSNLDDGPEINKIYAEYFPKNCPARASFQVAKLPLNAAVEIEAIAVAGEVVIERECICPTPPGKN